MWQTIYETNSILYFKYISTVADRYDMREYKQWYYDNVEAEDPSFPGCCCFTSIILILLFVGLIKSCGVAEREQEEEKEKQQERSLSNIELVKSRDDFHTSDVYVSFFDQHGIAIDADACKLLIINDNAQRVVLSRELLSVDIAIDDSSIRSTNRGSQVVGAALGGLALGPAGLIVGGLSGSTQSKMRVKNIKLRITTTGFDNPNHDILMYKSSSSEGDKLDSTLLAETLKTAELWHSRISKLLKEGDSPSAFAPQGSQMSPADEIRKLESLRNEGLITDAEFEIAKSKYLGIE